MRGNEVYFSIDFLKISIEVEAERVKVLNEVKFRGVNIFSELYI